MTHPDHLRAVREALTQARGALTFCSMNRRSVDYHAYEGKIRVAQEAITEGFSALTALESLSGGWQPIETAPKDGTVIIVYRPKASKPRYIPKVGTDYWGTSYVETGAWMSSNNIAQPTHWQPLPTAPIESGTAEGE